MTIAAHDNSDSLHVTGGPGRADVLASFNYADSRNYYLRKGHEVDFKVKMSNDTVVKVCGSVNAINRDLSGSIHAKGVWAISLFVTSVNVRNSGKLDHCNVNGGYTLPIFYDPDIRKGEIYRQDAENLRKEIAD